jgi:hypothetical protein
LAQCNDRDDLGRHDVSGAAAAIVVANGCGDHDRVWTAVEAAIKELDPPAGHFPNEVSALALATAIDVGGQYTVAVASDVINVTDPGITERIPARLVPQSDELGQPAVEAAPTGVAGDNRASPIGLTIRSGEGDAIALVLPCGPIAKMSNKRCDLA